MKDVIDSTWLGRSLENYKKLHEKTAKQKNVKEEFQQARTLTQGKKILFGYKKKNTK